MYKFSRLGKIILCGDSNARIGILDDYIYDLFLDYEINSAVPIDKRCSRDLQVNSYGRSLVELCIGNNLFVLNGRTMVHGRFLGAMYMSYVQQCYCCRLCYWVSWQKKTYVVKHTARRPLRVNKNSRLTIS